MYCGANYDYERRSQIGIVATHIIYDRDFDGDLSCSSFSSTMGEAAKKKRAAEAKAARNAKKDANQTQAAESPPASVDPILSGTKPPSDSKYSKKSKAVPEEKMPHVPSISTRHSTRSRSTLAAATSGSGEQPHTSAGLRTENIATRPRRSATAAAEALLQQVRLIEDNEDPDGDSDSETYMELDGDEDGSAIGGDNEGSSDDIEFVEGGEKELSLVAPMQQGLTQVSAVSRGAPKKASKVQVVEEEEEEEPSDKELGESVF